MSKAVAGFVFLCYRLFQIGECLHFGITGNAYGLFFSVGQDVLFCYVVEHRSLLM